jgi:membrane-bound ClpP family serine protease
MHEAGPPIALAAIGLTLWLAVSTTVAGFSIETIGLILFITGAVWLVIEMTFPRMLRD